MPNLNVSVFDGRPLLDIASYARHGPGSRDRLSSKEMAQIERTVRRTPEVVVKVLPRSSNDFAAVGRHIDYIGRKGEIELETDEGERLSGQALGRQLLEDWDLDLDAHRRKVDEGAALGRKPTKLVHKLLLSMPPGTPAQAVLAAARNLLREEFALKHRYVFALHTDEPHPHVHAVVKAVSEQGDRLNIRKATLRDWRAEFARQLRAQGVAANATERAVRGESRGRKTDGIFRAMRRGASTHMHARAREVAAEVGSGGVRVELGKAQLLATRRGVQRGWVALSELLTQQGQPELASEVRGFVDRMVPARTEKEWVATELLIQAQRTRTLERTSGP